MQWEFGKGLSFDCPACRQHRVTLRFRENGQEGFARVGDSFDNLTLLPEIQLPGEVHGYPICRTSTHWRGWIHNGRIRGF